MGDWDGNNIIKSCFANIRKAVMDQYEPIKILRTEHLIFLDEIWPDNSPQMIEFKRNDNGLILKNELMSTGKFQINQLTENNVEIIAKSLSKNLNIDTRYCQDIKEWKIFGVKHYRECTQIELNASEYPHKDWYDFKKNFNPNDVQAHLPSALQFYVHDKIKKKFNNAGCAMYSGNKLSFNRKFEVAHNFESVTSKSILNDYKNFRVF